MENGELDPMDLYNCCPATIGASELKDYYSICGLLGQALETSSFGVEGATVRRLDCLKISK